METLFVSFLENFGLIILSLIGVVLIFTIKKIAEKYGHRVDADIKNFTESLFTQIVQHGIAYAEQWTKNYINQNNNKPTNSEKLDMAFKFIVEELKRYSIFDLAEREIKNKIEAVLGLETIVDLNIAKSFPGNIDLLGGEDEEYNN